MIFIGYDYLNDEVEWKKIYWKNGEPTKYSISNIGLVRNDVKNKLIKLIYSKDYVRVYLTHNGKQKEYLVHRLVATAFIPNPDNKPQVNHINGIKHCNYLYNLEWATPSENIKHAYKNGLYKKKKKKHKKITKKKIHKICKLLEENLLNYSEIGRLVGCTRQYVARVHNKEVHTDISHLYKIDNYEVKKVFKITGDDAVNTKYSDEDIHALCKMIDSGLYALPELPELTGIPYQAIRNVYYGTCRKDISKHYNFIKESNPLYNKRRENAITICEMLDQGLNTREVAERLGVNRSLVRGIRSGSSWKSISKYYNFIKNKKYRK